MITGTTRLFVIIGDPITQVRSPQGFNALAERLEVDAVMVPLEMPRGAARQVVEALRRVSNLGGIVVTMPHKQIMLEMVDEAGDTARRAGGVNAVRCEADGRWVGDSFDGQGFIAGMRARGHDFVGRRVLVVGAGGAGAAIVSALASEGVGTLTLFDIDTTKAARVVASLRRSYPALECRVGAPDPADHDIVVNATPLGMAVGDPLPFDLDGASEGTLIADVVPTPEITPLLAAARERGHPIQPGRYMVEGQMEAICRYLGVLTSEDPAD